MSFLTIKNHFYPKKDELIRDPQYSSIKSTEFEETRRKIQNLFDAARYLSPQLDNFCNYVIPLGSPPRRILSTVSEAKEK